MKIITTEKIPIKMWLEEIEDGAVSQLKNLANLPFAFSHIAVMPDSHQGYGMPIGGVLATKGVISPNAVGVDIGCGMCAVRTSLTEISNEELKRVVGDIRNQVPVGMNRHKEEQPRSLMPEGDLGYQEMVHDYFQNMPICMEERSSARKSLGTLGGGNHFIEIQKGSDGYIWIMIHSGSRNLGKKVADHYNAIAKELNKKWHSSVPAEHDLAFLPLESDEGVCYIEEMNYCIEFALANRKLMMERALAVFHTHFPLMKYSSASSNSTEHMINIAHNYAKLENHFGSNVMVHRKGATLASDGTVGIIPGSQGSNSYITVGLGNRDSFNSSSHGAGRLMGRKDAEKRLDLSEEIKKLDDMGVLHAIRGIHDLDEAPGAYKNIKTVMDNQKDLVKISVELTPLAVIKG